MADGDPGLRAEREDGGRVLGLARLQLGGGEVGLVGRVREVLGLEGVRSTLAVSVAADAHQRPGQEVAGVELNAGRVRPYGELTAAGRVEGLRGEAEPERTVGPGG